jgi:Superinfection immunity protein
MLTLAALFVFAIYLLPLIIALARKVPAGDVAAMNILLGWTGVGWLVALVMACRYAPRTTLPPCYRCGAPADLHPGGRCPAPEISRVQRPSARRQ